MSVSPEQQRETFAAELREAWRTIVNLELMRCAGLMNLVPYGETDMAKLPVNVHTIAVRLVSSLVLEASQQEIALGRRAKRTLQMVVRRIHNTLKPFARRGEFYVEHLVGDAAIQREARVRLAGDGS